MATLKIEFANDAAMEHFKSWLDGAGEQDYWDWMSVREEEENGDITAIHFDYSKPGIIETKCGRLDNND